MTTTARNRSRTENDNTTTVTQYKNGTDVDLVVYNVKTNWSDSEVDDFYVDRFHERIANGEVINNPCSIRKRSVQCTDQGTLTIYDWSGIHEATGPLCEAYLSHHGIGSLEGMGPRNASEKHILDVKSKCLANMDKSPYAFMEDFVELKETLQFLKSPFSSLRDLSKDFSRDVKRSRRKNITRVISDTWLEYRFAASPLVRSIHDAALSFSDKRRLRNTRLTARSFSNDDSRNIWERRGYYGFPGSGYYDTFQYTDTYKDEYKAGILYEIANPAYTTSYKLGLRFKDIPETIWAVLPYSFMVDRVVNVSDAVRGFTNLVDPGIKIRAAWVTMKMLHDRSVKYVSHTNAGATSVHLDPTVSKKQFFEYKRDVWSPSMSDIRPPVDWGGLVEDATLIADLGSLIVSRFSPVSLSK